MSLYGCNMHWRLHTLLMLNTFHLSVKTARTMCLELGKIRHGTEVINFLSVRHCWLDGLSKYRKHCSCSWTFTSESRSDYVCT